MRRKGWSFEDWDRSGGMTESHHRPHGGPWEANREDGSRGAGI